MPIYLCIRQEIYSLVHLGTTLTLIGLNFLESMYVYTSGNETLKIDGIQIVK